MAIETFIIDKLINGPLSTTTIVSQTMRAKCVTKEAVYKALRGLLKKEIVVKGGKRISLSNQWVIDMAEKWRQAEAQYIGKANIKLLGDRNSVVYTCKTIDQLDSLWNHTILEICYLLQSETTLLFYSPHYWFPLIRGNSEHSLIHTLTARGHTWLQLAGYKEPMDLNLRKSFPLKEIEYHAEHISEKQYINVFGDYVLEISLDKKAADHIHRWYRNNDKLSEEALHNLEKVLTIKGTYKLKVSKNPKKAEKLRKLFAKYFLIKKSVK